DRELCALVQVYTQGTTEPYGGRQSKRPWSFAGGCPPKSRRRSLIRYARAKCPREGRGQDGVRPRWMCREWRLSTYGVCGTLRMAERPSPMMEKPRGIAECAAEYEVALRGPERPDGRLVKLSPTQRAQRSDKYGPPAPQPCAGWLPRPIGVPRWPEEQRSGRRRRRG
ncbi:unnamed protein product, partial [Sphacelaria rigidula]